MSCNTCLWQFSLQLPVAELFVHICNSLCYPLSAVSGICLHCWIFRDRKIQQFSLQTLYPVGGAIILLYLEKLAMPPGDQTKPLSFILPHFLTPTKVKIGIPPMNIFFCLFILSSRFSTKCGHKIQLHRVKS